MIINNILKLKIMFYYNLIYILNNDIHTCYNLIFIYNNDICVRMQKKMSPIWNWLIGDFNYSFLDREVKIRAITIIKIKSTISLLSNKFKLSKLYRI